MKNLKTKKIPTKKISVPKYLHKLNKYFAAKNYILAGYSLPEKEYNKGNFAPILTAKSFNTLMDYNFISLN